MCDCYKCKNTDVYGIGCVDYGSVCTIDDKEISIIRWIINLIFGCKHFEVWK